MSTIVYARGGESYLGSFSDRDLDCWKKMGKSRGYKYLYKGYRYYGGKKDSVIVFDNEKWSASKVALRRDNGFLGIRRYSL